MPRNSDRRLLPGAGNSQRESRLHFERLIICAQTLLVTIQQARLRQRFNILMHPPVISAEGNGERTNAPSGVSMHMAQKLKTPGRHNPRESLEGFEAHMPFGVPLCQLATLCAIPNIAARTAALKTQLALGSSPRNSIPRAIMPLTLGSLPSVTSSRSLAGG